MFIRAPMRARWFSGVADAAGEVEAAAGVRPQRGQVVHVGRALPGLLPMSPSAALAHLALGGARGLAGPMRRRQPATSYTRVSWRPSHGSVLTCDGPGGISAQAVVALRGLGEAGAIAPPPGGALVVRAWRGGRGWGLACGLVLGAAEGLGLGREAGRAAAEGRANGWDATVVSGLTALGLAQAGNPGNPPPEAAAHAASDAQVGAMIAACLAAGGIDGPTAGP